VTQDFPAPRCEDYVVRGVPGSLVGDEHIRNPEGDVEPTVDAANRTDLIVASVLPILQIVVLNASAHIRAVRISAHARADATTRHKDPQWLRTGEGT
jgi:hypothetical protein